MRVDFKNLGICVGLVLMPAALNAVLGPTVATVATLFTYGMLLGNTFPWLVTDKDKAAGE